MTLEPVPPCMEATRPCISEPAGAAASDARDGVEEVTLHPSRPAIVVAVFRRLVPHLVEATIIPMLIFYALNGAFGLRFGLLGALSWSGLAIGRRLVGRRHVPTLVILSAIGVTFRALVYVLSSSSFIFFLQPIIRATCTAALFAVSAMFGRPLIARFAMDFCPLSPEVRSRPAITELFSRLTYLWAGLNALGAAASLVLLITLPVSVFVGTATASTWVIMVLGVVVTVVASARVARQQELVTAIGPGGLLTARAVSTR